jgi:hypothetical protein
MTYLQPGLDPRRLMRLMRESIERCELDLSDLVVFTEAATGAYAVTPILAAMSGARHVYAVTRDTRYGTVQEVALQTFALAELGRVANRVTLLDRKDPAKLAEADIVTNSGHVRPLDAATISLMKPGAVIPLMYESWEFRALDVDLAACKERGIAVAGTNERHKSVDVFSYLGVIAVKQLLDAGIAVYGSRLLLLCDNDFAVYIEGGLTAMGAKVDVRASLSCADLQEPLDAVVVALKPKDREVLSAFDAERLASTQPGTLVAQFWGDIDRERLADLGLPMTPPVAPPRGHMGILLSDAGPDGVVRLQAAGLKVGQVLLARSPSDKLDASNAYVQSME